ncbi:putative Xaa-Pro aminopeptidase pepP [Erysiphe necator]|uniref:Xaa-Pro aminopeptidase n=1 Tax=Uncinula necator TaxID=52586 RepID=A0A0B1P938_UNCNE|nr:putative Xaa-Pro aminopeptidase pepP [Erysiphe necator]KHJ33830.1 putative xaa-pro dipeptidase protein [Erysiphe necator]
MENVANILAGKYPAKLHVQRVIQWMKERNTVTAGIIYLEGQKTKLLEDNDGEAPFRQRRYFYYLTGCPLPDSYFTYDIGSNKSVLYIPPVNPESVMWSGLPLSCTEALSLYDVDEVRTTDVAKDFLLQSEFSSLWTIQNQASDIMKFLELDNRSYIVNDSLLKEAIGECRVIKDEYEIALMKKASTISVAAHHAAIKAAKFAQNERELLGIFLEKCISLGAKEQAYSPIVASGTAAATLHYVKNDQPLSRKLNILLDAGAEYNCYASDITRTFPINGRFTPESKAVYDIVLEMQISSIQQLRKDVLWDQVHLGAHRIVIDGLHKLGIFQGDKTSIYDARTSVAFFPHGLGHYLGMDTHDTGGHPNYNDEDPYFRYLRVRGKLPTGSVITVEPGLYFCRFIIEPYLANPIHAKFINTEVLNKYWEVGGIRIEDNVLITETGHENLTSAVKTVEDMEKIQASI